jgi:hypothetical protein
MRVIISNHGYLRAKERFSLSKESIEKVSQRAFEKGLDRKDFKDGSLGRHLDDLFDRHKVADKVRIYGDAIFFFRDRCLITVYQLPIEFRKIVFKKRMDENNRQTLPKTKPKTRFCLR